MCGREGLDYNVLFRILDDRYPDRSEWQSAFHDIQIIEDEALAVFAERKE